MAKTKINFKKLQMEMEERMSKQRKNRNNWTAGLCLSPPKPQDIIDFNDIMFEGKNKKNSHRKWRQNKSINNHL